MTTAGQTSGVRAGIYCRISRSNDGDTTKTDDQERRCREVADWRGWPVADDHVYTDGSKSAWERNRKRPGWDRMLADVDAGKINAIVVYHGDRLIRQPYDLELLINLAYGKGIRLASPTGGRDLSNDDDLFILRIEAAAACRESASLSRRQKARYERDRLNGKVMAQGPGGRRFGYCSDGVTLFPADRCETELRREVTEAEIISEAAARVLAGESANRIEEDLRRRGWTTPAGKRIGHGSLKRWLVNPRYAGLMPDGETQAAWPAVLNRETWERARLLLTERAAAYPRDPGNGVRWLLSGIAVCGNEGCGRPLRVAHVSSRGYKSVVYGCEYREGCGRVWRNAGHLDAYVGAHVVGYLSNPLHPAGHVPEDIGSAAEWAVLERERAETDDLLADYRSSAGRARLLLSRLDEIDRRMGELRERAAGDSRARLIERYRGTTREQWENELPLDVRRALVAACFKVTVLPASGRGPGFRTEDVRLEPLG